MRDRQMERDALLDETRRIWDANATFWDGRIGEGNTFHKTLVEPTVDRLLALRPGDSVLEIGCGNGAYARHLAEQDASVLATDFSAVFPERARERSAGYEERIQYRQLDATDEAALRDLGAERFDAACANMVLMDIAAIELLFAALPRLLTPRGRFVFAIMHPCRNSTQLRAAGRRRSARRSSPVSCVPRPWL